MMHINDMSAGRELDILVAERVMGFVWATFPSDMSSQFLVPATFFDALHSTTVPLLVRATGNEPNKKPLLRFVPLYSADIGAAWDVAEHVGMYWDVHLGRHFSGRCTCTFDRTGNYMDTTGLADTMPLAICRAALKAVGADRE